MQENPDLAACFSKQGTALWKQLAEDFPLKRCMKRVILKLAMVSRIKKKITKNIFKVWNDQKRYVRKKLTFNAGQIRRIREIEELKL